MGGGECQWVEESVSGWRRVSVGGGEFQWMEESESVCRDLDKFKESKLRQTLAHNVRLIVLKVTVSQDTKVGRVRAGPHIDHNFTTGKSCVNL